MLNFLRLTFLPVSVTIDDQTSTSHEHSVIAAMNTTKPTSRASIDYDLAKNNAIHALKAMTQAMREMRAEHEDFLHHFSDVQKRLEDMKEANGGKELDVEIIWSTALDSYFSEGNHPKVTAFGMMKVLEEYEEEMMELGKFQNETVKRLEQLLWDRLCKGGNGQSATSQETDGS